MSTNETVTLSVEDAEGTIKTLGKTYAVAIRDYDDRTKLIASRHESTGGVRAALYGISRREGIRSVGRAWVFHLPSGDLVWSGNPTFESSLDDAAEAAWQRSQREMHS